jgi:hypothetical protein
VCFLNCLIHSVTQRSKHAAFCCQDAATRQCRVQTLLPPEHGTSTVFYNTKKILCHELTQFVDSWKAFSLTEFSNLSQKPNPRYAAMYRILFVSCQVKTEAVPIPKHGGVGGGGGVAPLIFYLYTRWRWVVSHRPAHPVARRLGGPRSRSGHGDITAMAIRFSSYFSYLLIFAFRQAEAEPVTLDSSCSEFSGNSSLIYV